MNWRQSTWVCRRSCFKKMISTRSKSYDTTKWIDSRCICWVIPTLLFWRTRRNTWIKNWFTFFNRFVPKNWIAAWASERIASSVMEFSEKFDLKLRWNLLAFEFMNITHKTARPEVYRVTVYVGMRSMTLPTLPRGWLVDIGVADSIVTWLFAKLFFDYGIGWRFCILSWQDRKGFERCCGLCLSQFHQPRRKEKYFPPH
jgi:hypothetical protein